MKRYAALVAVSAVFVLALAACGSDTPGSPIPGPVNGPSVSDAPSASTIINSPSPTSAADDGPLAGVNPCHLITKADGAQFGIQHARRDDKYGLRSCSYTGPDTTIAVTFFAHQALADYYTRFAQGAPVKTTVRGHRAELQREHGASCGITFAVTPTSSVNVGGIDGGADQQRACALAKKAAPIVADAIFGS